MNLIPKLAAVVVSAVAATMARPVVAVAQTPYQLVPVLTDGSAISASNRFAAPASSAINDAGDFVFIGNRSTALFYRKAGTASAVRVIQYGDEVPGIPGSRVAQMAGTAAITPSGLAVFRVDIYVAHRLNTAVLAFDGTTLTTLISGLDVAPNSGGAKFDRSMTFQDVNNAGDLLVATPLLPLGSTATAQPTLFLKPFGGAVVRVAGYGDVDPNTGGTFTSMVGMAVNDSGEVLLRGALTGGSSSSGIFVWKSGQPLRKVIANGDPNPAGGTFTDNFANTTARLNHAGLVVFVAGNSLVQHTQAGGTTIAVANGSAVPAPMGGTYSSITGLSVLGQGSDAVFTASVTGGASANGLFRYRPGSGVEVVVRAGEPVPGVPPGPVINTFPVVAVNSSGTVAFQGNGGPGAHGIFTKPAGGALSMKVAQFSSVPTFDAFIHLIGNAITLLSNGDVMIRPNITGGPEVYHANIRWSGAGPFILMSTADLLPAGARTVVRPPFMTAAGNYIGIELMKAGGRPSIGVFNPSAQTGNIVGTDGDLVAPYDGFLALNNHSTVLVSTAGHVAVTAQVIGGNQNQLTVAIFAGDLNSPLMPVAFDGLVDNGGRTLFSVSINGLNARPSTINATGQVAFSALTGGQRGMWVGAAGAVPQKVVLIGDAVSTGATITSFVTTVPNGFNDAGQLLFSANTAAGAGLFIATAGSTPVKVVQVGDAAPGGGTFAGFGTTAIQAMNGSGQIAFVASVSGSSGGVFLATPSGPTTYTIDAIARHGDASPAGGTFSITTPRADVVLNNAGDVAFTADLTGGASDSGIFVKPAAGALQTVAAQGQAAPGTAGQFSTFPHGLNNIVGEPQDISATGAVAFRASVTPPGQPQFAGWWHRETNGVIQPMAIAPSTVPAFEGGTAASLPTLSNWMSGDRFPLWIPMANGPRVSGVFLHLPAAVASATGAGTSVVVTPVDAVTGTSVTVTFSQVTVPGETTLVRQTYGPAVERRNYRIGLLAAYHELTTTASIAGPIQVCIDYADHGIPPGMPVRLLHYEGNVWVDVTSSVGPGTVICGTSTSLSPFVVAVALNEPASNIIQNGDFSSGATGWQTFSSRIDEFNVTHTDPNYIVWAVNAGVFEYHRVGPTPPDKGTSAVVLQNTGQAAAQGAPLVARFDLGNSDPARKRITVLIHDKFFGDLSVCTFWLAPNAPMRTYAMRTHTTMAWTDASISFYAASAGSSGGSYRLDNVVMGPGIELGTRRTDCVDPLEPGYTNAAPSANLLTNGDFTNGLANWETPFTIETQALNGKLLFRRPSSTPPNGVLLQPSGQPVAAGNVLTATFRMGNPNGVRLRVTVLLHDFTFGDLAACTFWIPSGPTLGTYMVRTYTTQPWSNATVAFYPATTLTNGWLELDDVTLATTPSAPTYGTDCVEPGDESGLSEDVAPAGTTRDRNRMYGLNLPYRLFLPKTGISATLRDDNLLWLKGRAWAMGSRAPWSLKSIRQ